MKAEQPATVRHIQNRLKTAELAATASLCPHESFDDISFLLRPSDPHQCGCTQSQSVFPMTHTMTDIWTQPRCTTLRCYYYYSIESGGSKVGRLLAHYEPKGSFSMNLHYSSCRHCSTYYTWERFADLITLRRNTSGRAQNPWDSYWIQLLDPTSYHLEEPDTCHELWCDSPQCAT
jgi:hypothetical protein